MPQRAYRGGLPSEAQRRSQGLNYFGPSGGRCFGENSSERCRDVCDARYDLAAAIQNAGVCIYM